MSFLLWSFQGLFPCHVHSVHLKKEAQLRWTPGDLWKDSNVQGSAAFSCCIMLKSLFPIKMWQNALDLFYIDLCQNPFSLFKGTFPKLCSLILSGSTCAWLLSYQSNSSPRPMHLSLGSAMLLPLPLSLGGQSPKAKISFYVWGRKEKKRATIHNLVLNEKINLLGKNLCTRFDKG